MNMPRLGRGSSAAIDGDDAGPCRQPFRTLQPPRTFRSPSLPIKSVHMDTPPREVILTPRATPKPVKRKASSRPSAQRQAIKVKVKSEPPEVDLARVRPPSPSDDPLLLSGTPPMRSPLLRSRLTPQFPSSPSDTTQWGPSLSFSARLFDSGRRIDQFGAVGSPDTSNMNHALPTFNAPRAVAETSGIWSDSEDDDEFNLRGEYTGKYKLLTVPTKAEPPTREESWGRPVSPFPYSEIMERSLPLSEVVEDDEGREDVLDVMEDVESWEAATEPPPSDPESSPQSSASEDEFTCFNDDFPVLELDAESTQVRPLSRPQEHDLDSDHTSLGEEEEEAQIDRELSVAVDDGPRFVSHSQDLPINAVEDGSSDEEDDVEGEDIIKITSDDPTAAARAAAILRMHDYDCILAAERKKRSGRSTKSSRQRRKTIENAGIAKSYMESKSQRWQTLWGTETSPGSRSLPLLELWRDAEDSVFLEHHSMSYCDASFTLSPLKTMPTCPEPTFPPQTGKWTRDCWKCLDECLAAERLAVASARGLDADLFADLGEISKDAVLDRFATQVGGESILVSLGLDWSRDNLMLRLDVLIKKQSQRVARALTKPVLRETTEPRYRGLLQEAMALSAMEGYATSISATSDTTTVSDRPCAHKTILSSLKAPCTDPELGWLTNHERGPIQTPSRTPDPRPPHPKDQVQLRQASVLKESQIPIPIRPKRLVDLRHLSPIKSRSNRPTARRSSGCSVKDLVKQFESLDR